MAERVMNITPRAQPAQGKLRGRRQRLLRTRVLRRSSSLEVFVEPNGMVDVALRELGAHLVVREDDCTPSPYPG
jgi:hypothetical protein